MRVFIGFQNSVWIQCFKWCVYMHIHVCLCVNCEVVKL